nr:GDSL esterase/lipase At5g03610-like [Physcomitrium patens]|eukprot:XP_024376766.1 GDSL esterase/lipase At5g03610-like [Physcomitrella patens]
MGRRRRASVYDDGFAMYRACNPRCIVSRPRRGWSAKTISIAAKNNDTQLGIQHLAYPTGSSISHFNHTRFRAQWSALVRCKQKAALGSASKGDFEKIFIIGDSFVDTGNRDPNNSTYTPIGRVNQDREPPYGRTRPGDSDGRFSDGKVLSDFLADFMGLKPPPYRLLNGSANSTRLEDGINFAVAGCGVFDNLGFTKTGDQIRQLTDMLNTDLYSKDVIFSEALIMYASSGNDYAAYRLNNGSTDILSIIEFVRDVVTQLTKDLTTLYNLGFRTFAISKLAPVGCLPYSAVAKNYSVCDEAYNAMATLRNLNLMWLVAAFPSAKIIFLDNQLPFATVAYNLSNRCESVSSSSLGRSRLPVRVVLAKVV